MGEELFTGAYVDLVYCTLNSTVLCPLRWLQKTVTCFHFHIKMEIIFPNTDGLLLSLMLITHFFSQRYNLLSFLQHFSVPCKLFVNNVIPL